MNEYEITVPYPPSTNRIWRRSGQRIHLSSVARDYKSQVAGLAYEANIKPLAGAIRLTLKVYRPRKSGDLGNREKIISDALNGLAWNDDSQITEIHMFRYDDKEKPRVEVTITSLS